MASTLMIAKFLRMDKLLELDLNLFSLLHCWTQTDLPNLKTCSRYSSVESKVYDNFLVASLQNTCVSGQVQKASLISDGKNVLGSTEI